jgi:hypothetical protein
MRDGDDEVRTGPPRELHLLGKTADEALPEIDKFLDGCAREGRDEARIVHGHGTGRLRTAVRKHLKGIRRSHRSVPVRRPRAETVPPWSRSASVFVAAEFFQPIIHVVGGLRLLAPVSCVSRPRSSRAPCTDAPSQRH